jgi:hypothetical protein
MWMKTPNTILSNRDFVNGCGEFKGAAVDRVLMKAFSIFHVKFDTRRRPLMKKNFSHE